MDTPGLEVLRELADGPVGGPEMAVDLGISREAVWKRIESLRAEGFRIEGTSSGYELQGIPEYDELGVALAAPREFTIVYRDVVGSTNEVAREYAGEGESGIVVVADEQTGGRGRLGREWSSPSGGIWMSVVMRPAMSPSEVSVVTHTASVAVTETVRELGVEVGIKWPNDVLVRYEGEDAKVAGILTEFEGEADQVNWAIIGIGLNANVSVSELPAGATSLLEVSGPVTRRCLVGDILRKLTEYRDEREAVLARWKEYSLTLGERVRVELDDREVEGEAIDVTESGALVVKTSDGEEVVHSGDCYHLQSA